MISVVVPAYNEERQIRACLEALLEDAKPGELEVIVACNGCRDRTAEIAREWGPPVRVLETEVASKRVALNMGDAAATGFPRVFVDADVQLRTAHLRRVVEALASNERLVASPRAVVDLEGCSLAVRAYYYLWLRTPYVQDGMMGCGVYALSPAARERFDEFPDLIADDAFIRALFRLSERAHVPEATVRVLAPRRLWELCKVATRNRLGMQELGEKRPDLIAADRDEKRYGEAVRNVLRDPRAWLCAPIYLFVNVVGRLRARRQRAAARSATPTGTAAPAYAWERDESTR